MTKIVILKVHTQRHLTFLDFLMSRTGGASPLCMARIALVLAGLSNSALQPKQVPESARVTKGLNLKGVFRAQTRLGTLESDTSL